MQASSHLADWPLPFA